MSKPKYLITHSLLSEYAWLFKSGDLEAFKSYLRREPKQQTTAMLDGIQFENMVQAYCEGSPPPENHKWREGVIATGNIVKWGAYQAALSRDITVDGMDFVVYGKLDFLKAGTIYDTKYSTRYHVGKYLKSTQHSVYLFLCQSALQFIYLACDGKWVYKERYTRDDCVDVERSIREFVQFCDSADLLDEYKKYWESKY